MPADSDYEQSSSSSAKRLLGNRSYFHLQQPTNQIRGFLPAVSKQQIVMTTLFRHLQPAKKFRITVGAIAQLLKIPKHLIVRVECWAYIIFVHRTDEGGQFISYRRLQHWLNAVAYQIQNCSTCPQRRSLWLAIEKDFTKHKKQYDDKSNPFLQQISTKHWDTLKKT